MFTSTIKSSSPTQVVRRKDCLKVHSDHGDQTSGVRLIVPNISTIVALSSLLETKPINIPIDPFDDYPPLVTSPSSLFIERSVSSEAFISVFRYFYVLYHSLSLGRLHKFHILYPLLTFRSLCWIPVQHS